MGSMGSMGSTGAVQRIKTGKRRRILVALRAVVISSEVERSSLQNSQCAKCATSITACFYSLAAYPSFQTSEFRVSPSGVLPFDCVQKRFSGFCGFYGFYGFYGFKGGSAAHNAIEAPQSINRAMPESLRIAGFQF